MSGKRIVADVGGTNVRIALANSDGALSSLRIAPVKDFPNFYVVLSQYIEALGGLTECEGIVVGGAGPVEDGRLKLTNGDWEIEWRALSTACAGLPARVVNDLEAVALAVPHLGEDDLAKLRPDTAPGQRARLVVNVGTGFGGALAVPAFDRWLTVPCEPGHMRLALDPDLAAKLKASAPSVENVLSGLAFSTYWKRADDASQEPAWDEFGALLGQVCGDLVLATGAWGGLYLCGSVAQAWWQRNRFETFVKAFANKGPMSPRMENIFIAFISDATAPLKGLARVHLG